MRIFQFGSLLHGAGHFALQAAGAALWIYVQGFEHALGFPLRAEGRAMGGQRSAELADVDGI